MKLLGFVLWLVPQVLYGQCGTELAKRYWGVVIPGLAMNAQEMPELPGLLRLQNPEIGDGCVLGDGYELVDVARCHVETLKAYREELADNPVFIGMSMGGMVLSILASEFRSELPEKSRFYFFVTSPNLDSLPAVPNSIYNEWLNANPRDFSTFRSVMYPLFAEGFVEENPHVLDRYVTYRMEGGNGQSGSKFVRQLKAIRKFRGVDYFPRINPHEAFFTGGGADKLFGPAHSEALRQLLPGAYHREISGLGHMIHLEMPQLFELGQ